METEIGVTCNESREAEWGWGMFIDVAWSGMLSRYSVRSIERGKSNEEVVIVGNEAWVLFGNLEMSWTYLGKDLSFTGGELIGFWCCGLVN